MPNILPLQSLDTKTLSQIKTEIYCSLSTIEMPHKKTFIELLYASAMFWPSSSSRQNTETGCKLWQEHSLGSGRSEGRGLELGKLIVIIDSPRVVSNKTGVSDTLQTHSLTQTSIAIHFKIKNSSILP